MSFRDELRALSVFAGDLPTLEPEADPVALFQRWLREALAAGVREPHAMTLSTAADGVVDARVLILKDIRDGAWWFATSALSPKGRQLTQHPAAALTFYWPQHGRQVRVQGPVVTASSEVSAADLAARSASAQAAEPHPEAWTLYGVRATAIELFQGRCRPPSHPRPICLHQRHLAGFHAVKTRRVACITPGYGTNLGHRVLIRVRVETHFAQRRQESP